MMAKKQAPMQGPAPVYRSRDNWKPPVKQKKSAQTRLTNQRTAQRENFEASDTPVKGSAIETVSGQQRMASPPMLETRVEGPTLPGDSRSTPAYANPIAHYREMGWHDSSRHSEGQQALPGMGSLMESRAAGLTSDARAVPDVVPVARWHHLSNTEKMATESHAARFGVTRASAKAAFAANLDQSFDNAHAAGATPHARDFYVDQSAHMPAGHIVQASKDAGVSVSGIATATSITSPQTEWGPTAAGHYPNIRAARHAAMADPAAPLTKAGIGHPTLADDTTKKIGTFTGNVVKAAGAVRQSEAGTLAANLRGAGSARNPQGSPIFGGKQQQKTTAFRNALVDPEGPQASFVSDVHSGGRGMAPHLSPTQAGEYLKHPGIHQFHDHIAREVMRERGLQSVNNVQAAQWGQAQLDSGQVKPAVAFPQASRGQTSGQMDMFGGDDAPHPHAAAQAHVDAAEDQHWTAGHEARHQATTRKNRGSLPVDPDARKEGW